jgi:hypothetical protein
MKVYFFNLASMALASLTVWIILFRMWSQLDGVLTVLLITGSILCIVGLFLFAGWGRTFPGAQTRKSAISFCVADAFCLFSLIVIFTSSRLL